MKFDLTTTLGSMITRRPDDDPGTITLLKRGPNKQTGAYVSQYGSNDGRGITRIDTKSGCVLGKVCYIDKSKPIKPQIIDAYRHGFTEQEIANASGYSQSRVSQILNGK